MTVVEWTKLHLPLRIPAPFVFSPALIPTANVIHSHVEQKWLVLLELYAKGDFTRDELDD